VHINTLLLGAFCPLHDEDFLYAPGGEDGEEFRGEAAQILEAVGISTAGKTRDAVHAEFQRGRIFLTHVLECPLNGDPADGETAAALLTRRLQTVATRIRAVAQTEARDAVTEELAPVVEIFLRWILGCPVVLDHGKPFGWRAVPERVWRTAARSARHFRKWMNLWTGLVCPP